MAGHAKVLLVKPVILLMRSAPKVLGHDICHFRSVSLFDKVCWVKDLISASQALTKLPGLFAEFSRPVKKMGTILEEQDGMMRKYWLADQGQWVRYQAFRVTGVEAISNKVFNFASWSFNVCDTIGLVGRYHPLHKFFGQASPWVEAVAGGYMGVQSAYMEVRFQCTFKKLSPAERYLGALNLVTSITDCFLSASNFLKLCYKDCGPAWLAKVHFGLTVGATVLPAVQKCAQVWVEKNGVPAKPKKT
jgi:hypothetical protein